MEAKSFEECCDEVAKKNRFDTWRRYEGYLINHEPHHVRMHYLSKAAELYCQSQKAKAWEEACEAQFKNLALISFPPEIIATMKKQPNPINPFVTYNEETESEPLAAAKRLIKQYREERDDARNVIQELEQKNKELSKRILISSEKPCIIQSDHPERLIAGLNIIIL